MFMHAYRKDTHTSVLEIGSSSTTNTEIGPARRSHSGTDSLTCLTAVSKGAEADPYPRSASFSPIDIGPLPVELVNSWGPIYGMEGNTIHSAIYLAW
jgi:hypothetical protein